MLLVGVPVVGSAFSAFHPASSSSVSPPMASPGLAAGMAGVASAPPQIHAAPGAILPASPGAGSASIPGLLCSGYVPGLSTPLTCPAHDSSTLSFFSNLPGSGGNVSWNLTLPTDRSTTQNQSDLYSAAWVGLPLSDPFGWMGECFVEVQFYPDQSFYNGVVGTPALTANGQWVGAVVGWQVDPINGVEDPCYYEPLYLNGVAGPAYLNMSQGDRVTLTLTGFTGSRTGEQVVVKDVTTSQSSNQTLFNSTGRYALNPVYTTNSWQAPTLWAMGGGYPISFGFDLGRSVNGVFPSNNSFGGCSPGFGGATDPSAPCGSYDPGAWANDTLAPWKISIPSFFNKGTTHSSPTQVGFDSTVGGVAGVGARSNGECTARAASGDCSYPWFSYACGASAFEFGAMDYSGISNDFHKLGQYSATPQFSALQIPFYPATNLSVPVCGAISYGVTLHIPQGTTGDTILYLSAIDPFPVVETQNGTLPGTYTATAVAGPGSVFNTWTPVGNMTVSDRGTPTTTVHVTGPCILVAKFTRGNTIYPNTTVVQFTDTPGGSIGVTPSTLFSGPRGGNGNPIATVASGHSLPLHPGTYTVEAYPASGYNFTRWASNNSGITFASPGLPITWMTVTSTTTTAMVTAHYAASTSTSFVTLNVVGNGTATLGSLAATTGTPASGSLAVGGWALSATPGVGANAVLWTFSPGASMTNFSTATLVDLMAGSARITATFVNEDLVDFLTTPPLGAMVSMVTAGGVGPSMENNTTQDLAPGTYRVQADPAPVMVWSAWVATGGVSVTSPGLPLTAINVTGPGTLTAHFAKATKVVIVKFGSTPAPSGKLRLDGTTNYSTLAGSVGLSTGLHTISAEPVAGSAFLGWNLSAKIHLVGTAAQTGEVINVTGTGTVVAMFSASPTPLTFVLVNPAVKGSAAVHLVINSVALPTGASTFLPLGVYNVSLTGTKAKIQFWTATSNLTVLLGTAATNTITVNGSGTVYVVLAGSGGVSAGVPIPSPSLGAPAPSAVAVAARIARVSGSR